MKHALCLLLCLGALATAGTNLVFRVHPLMFADPEPAADLARQIVSPAGKVTLDTAHGRLLVMATEDQHRQITDLIRQISVQPPNVQIQVRIRDAGSDASRGIGVTSAHGGVIVGNSVRGGGEIRGFLGDQTTLSSRDSVQLLTVSSGKRAWINVCEETPYVEWFLDYGVRFGYLQAGIAWRQVGARLAVEPRVIGDGQMLQVKLIPELSYFVDNKLMTTAFINAATEVTVANGAEFHVGSTDQNREFMNRFLIGSDRTRQQRAVDIVLKATILP